MLRLQARADPEQAMNNETIASALAAAFQRARALDAPVNDRLALYSEALRQHFPAYADAFDQLVARLGQANAGASAPGVGEIMPSFLLPNEQGRLIGLADVLAQGPAAITFLRGHWCPFCRLHAQALAQIEDRATAAGGQIVAITPERQVYTHRQKAEAGAGFQVLSDIENGFALSLNLAIWIDTGMQTVLKDYGRDLALYQGTASWFVPIPATFIVARDGIITARFVDPDYSRRMDIEDLISALQAAA
jgi:peroxiredoxin